MTGRNTPALRVENASKSFGAKRALCDVSLTAAPGEFVAVLGINGAGKSTLFSLLTGLLDCDDGMVEVLGHDITRSRTAALSKLGIVFQEPTLDPDLSVSQNMRYFCALHGISKARSAERIGACLAQLDMVERKDEKVRALNGGHRRRMEIARALVHEPQVLLLDEPTVGLDATTRSAITNHVHQLARDGMCVLWATHLVDEIGYDDTVILLHEGRVVRNGKAAELGGSEGLYALFDTVRKAGAAP